MNSVTLSAQCKINLTMDVISKRDDGYHEVATIMQSITLADTVKVSIKRHLGINVKTNALKLPSDMRNTAYKAASIFMRRAGITGVGVHIQMTKNTPAGAGLGGGSADAAAVIVALDRLFNTRMPREELLTVGAEVGSDVPFCILGGTALATGRGEKIRGLNDLPQCAIIIVKPAFSLSTPKMFAALGSASLKQRPDTEAALRALENNDLAGVASQTLNVFEEVLPTYERREIDRIKSLLLSKKALCASMTGSGSAVFALFDELYAANDAYKTVKSKYRNSYIVQPSQGGKKRWEEM